MEVSATSTKGETHAEAEARRKANRVRAEAAMEKEKEELQQHLQEVDQRLHAASQHKQALREKRLADEFDPTPAVRKMFIDTQLAVAAQVPGPGAYSAREHTTHISKSAHALRDDFGTTFAVAPFSPKQRHARDYEWAGSPERWKLKSATQFPGPPAYDNINTLHRRSDVATGIGPKIGTTFGLPPEIRQIRGKPHPEDVPPAHDALRQIAYLKGIPAPDAYENNTNPMQKHRNRVKMVPSDEPSRLEKLMLESSRIPGPGAYEIMEGQGSQLSKLSTVMGSGDEHVKSDLEIKMETGSKVPGPGAYDHYSQLRSAGSPRFAQPCSSKGNTMMDQVIERAKFTPGAGSYHPTPTFAEELRAQRALRKMIKEGGAELESKASRGSPRSKKGKK